MGWWRMFYSFRPMQRPDRGSAPVGLALIAAVAFMVLGLLFLGSMMAMMAWGGDHMGMMRRGSGGGDQTPVVSDERRLTVEIRDYEFFPARLTVNPGTEVTWVNRDSVPHNAVADDAAFDTGTLDDGESVSLVLDDVGEYSYVCTFHPGMQAALTVR